VAEVADDRELEPVTSPNCRVATSFPLPNSSTDLTGQVALVTGASAGLGRRFAAVLAAAGADVVVAARRAAKLDEVVAEITARGGRCAPLVLDVSKAEKFTAAIDRAEAAFGTITVLVNNAGVPDAQRAHKMSLELIDTVIDTNMRGPYVLSCEIARRLIAAKLPGRIINLSSKAAFRYSGEGAALYAVTKSAINRMTEALAVEWVKYGINVNAIAPGAFSSEMMDGLLSRIGDISGGFPRQRLGDPAQLDSTLLFLAAPSSEFVTGTIVRADDGQDGR
jgi:NAD(P)-dependent dehydrogenase (short-subunit alcohol dehydrogenase family)